MSQPSPGTVSWGLSAVAVSLFLAAGTALVYYHAESDAARPVEPRFADTQHANQEAQMIRLEGDHALVRRDNSRSVPPAFLIHSVQIEEHQGKPVVRIQLTPGGDFVLMDADTGKFIEQQSAPPIKGAATPGPAAVVPSAISAQVM
jgi:hypothetical protein